MKLHIDSGYKFIHVCYGLSDSYCLVTSLVDMLLITIFLFVRICLSLDDLVEMDD